MVGAVSTADVLLVWEEGIEKGNLDRGLGLLGLVRPDVPRSRLELIPIGRRNRALLELRRALFGPSLRLMATCPRCALELEVGVEVDTLLMAPTPGSDTITCQADGWWIECRLPTTADLRQALQSGGEAQAMAEVCIQRVQGPDDEQQVTPDQIPPSTMLLLIDQWMEKDPLTLIELGLACEGCGTQWSTPLDVVEHVFVEVGVLAGRVLQDVHTLARAYGWREVDILAMSPRRRQVYLNLVRG